MKQKGHNPMKAILLSLCTLAVASTAVAGPPPIPATPAPVDDVVLVRPFTLENGYTFNWCKERPQVTSGVLLVLKVDPSLVVSRQVAEPVLYVGSQTAERINIGYGSGYVVAVVPGDVDLTKDPIWFGTPDLPERVDAEKVKAERALAEQAGIKPFTAEQINTAAVKGGDRLAVADVEALMRNVAPLITEYAPDEQHLADAFLVPVTK